MSNNLDTRRRIGNGLRVARLARGLSQAEVAKVAAVSRATIVALEQDPGGARVHSLLAMAAACGVDLDLHDDRAPLLARKLARMEQHERDSQRYAQHMRLAARLALSGAGEAVREAQQTIVRWERGKTCSAWYVESWRRILSGSQPAIGRRLVDLEPDRAAALFQNTPFSATVGAYRPRDRKDAWREN